MATSQQRVPQESSVLIAKYDHAVKRNAQVLRKINKHKASCNLYRARQYINSKRKATWGWQDKLLMPHTKTSYAEKKVHGCKYLKWSGKHWAKIAYKHYKLYVAVNTDHAKAICFVFGSYCQQALVVARCESGHSMSTHAHNGQYLGMFQMGSYARKLYGHSEEPLVQAWAAYRYFVASGKDWSPWDCQP